MIQKKKNWEYNLYVPSSKNMFHELFGRLGFAERSCEYQDLRHRVGDPSLVMGCISTVDIYECNEEGGDEVR